MEKSTLINRKWRQGIVCVILGIFLASTFLASYSFAYITEEELANGSLVVFFVELSQWINGYGIVWAFLAVIIGWLLFKTWNYWKDHDEKLQWRLIIVSLVFGFANVAGLCMFYMDALPRSVGTGWSLVTFFFSLGWALAFYVAAYWFLWVLENKLCGGRALSSGSKAGKGFKLKIKNLFCFLDQHIWLTAFIVILLCWLPWIILYYPASMDYDVYFQISSFVGNIPKTNHHPWFATCVLGVFYQLGVRLGSENVGIFLFVLIRDVLMSMIFATGVRMLKNSGIRRCVYVIVLLFYAVTPVWGAYAKHAFKDTFSAGLFALYTITLIVLIRKVREREASTWDFVFYGLVALLTSLFRNNCIYCVLPVTILLIIWLIAKRERWYRLVIIAVCVAAYFGYNQYIYRVAGVEKTETAEALAIPLQQTARVVKYHSDEIGEEQRAAIDGYLIYDELGDAYDPIISDPIKDRVRDNEDSESLRTYLSTWAGMITEFPIPYLEAFVGQSYGYYAFTPKHEYWEGNWNSNMAIFDWIGNNPYDFGYDFHYGGDWERARQVLDKWADVWQQIPVLNLTNMIALYTWCVILVGYYLWKKKRYAEVLPVVALIIFTLTCMASPVNDCFRYFAPVAASAPMLLAMIGKREAPAEQSGDEKEDHG